MSLLITKEQLAARERARAKLMEVATYVDELWRSPVPLTQAEVNGLQNTRDLLIAYFSLEGFTSTTSTYFRVEEEH